MARLRAAGSTARSHWGRWVGLGLAAVFVASVIFIAPAGAGTVSGVAVSTSSSTEHDLAATWTVTLQSSATGALDGSSGDFVTVVFPAGITVAAPPLGASLSSGFAGSCSSPPAVTTGQSVEIDLPPGCSLPASTLATITFTGIDPAAGTYQASGFTVASSIDATAAPASGSDIVIGVGGGGGGGGTQASAVSFTPADATAGATGSWTIGFTSSAGGALAGGAGFGYVVVTFPSGFGIASSATFGSGFSCTGSHPAVQDVGGNTVELDLPSGCTLAASTAATLTLGGVANPASAGSYSGAALATSADIAPTGAGAITIAPAPGPPGAPTVTSVSAGIGEVTVNWAAPASDGGLPITAYVVTSSPDALTCSAAGADRTCVVSGLTGGRSYTFTVTAANSAGTGPPSTASLPATPSSSGPPAQLVVSQQPGGAAAHAPLATQPVVRVEDSLGRLVVTSTSTIAVSGVSCAGAVTGSSVAAVAGVATFTGISVDAAGSCTLRFTDAADALTIDSQPFTVATPLTTSATSLVASPAVAAFGSSVTLTATVTGSAPTGIVAYAVDGAAIGTAAIGGSVSVASLAVGTHTVRATYPGDLVNTPSQGETQVVVERAPTALVALQPTTPGVHGRPVTLAVSGLPVAATGNVVFAASGVALCTATVAAGGASCSASLPGGHVAVRASYGGDASYEPSDVDVGLDVSPAAIDRFTVRATKAPGDVVRTFALAATGLPADATGAVSFTAGGTAVCSAQASGGAATCTGIVPASGTVVVDYAGDASYAGARASTDVTVQRAPATVTIVEPAAGGTFTDGDSVAFEAAVAAGAGDVPVPTGRVVFRVGDREACAATLAGGRAACTARLRAADSGATISASYDGDAFVAPGSASEAGPTVAVPPPTHTTSNPTSTPTRTPTTTTTAPPPGTSTHALPTRTARTGSPAATPAAREGLAVRLAARAGARAAGSRVAITALGLAPRSYLLVTVHSAPRVLARLRVGADGVLRAHVLLPDGLEPGAHRLIVEGIGRQGQRVSKALGFVIDTAGRFVRVAAKGAEGVVEEIATYTPSRHAHDVIGIFATWFALLAVTGVGGLAGGAPGAFRERPSRQRKSASLAGAKTKVHKFKWEGQAPGDAGITWRSPGWSRLDAISFALPTWLAKRSALAGRLLVDASYLRAMIGTLSLAIPAAGIVLGTLAANGDGRPPALGLVVALLVLGIADALAGFLAGAAFVLVSAVAGSFATADSARTLLGIAALWFVVPLVAGAARPFRRPLDDLDAMVVWTRVADLVVAALLGAWVTEKIVHSWAGLSGLELPVIDHAGTLALVSLGCIVARFALETVCAVLYPERLRAVQPPGKLPFAGRPHQLVSAAFRTAVFVFVAIAFVGSSWQLWVAAALFLVPSVVAVFQDKLPNSERLHKLVPGGILKTVLLLFVGQWYFMAFKAHVAPENLLRDGLVFLGLPSLAIMAAGLFGRDGEKREEGPAHQAAGTLVLVAGVLFVLGYFS